MVKILQQLKRSYIDWVIAEPLKCLLLVCVFIAISLVGLSNLGLTGDYKDLFDATDDHYLKYDEIKDEYAQNPIVVFIITDKEKDLFNEQSVALIAELTEKLWTMPFSVRVDSITNYQRVFADKDTFNVRSLLDLEGQRDVDFEQLKTLAVTDDNIKDRLISSNGHTTAVVVTIALPDEERGKALTQIVEIARKLTDEFRVKYPNLEVHLSGELVMEQVLLDIVAADMQNVMPLVLAIGFLIILVLLGSLFAAVCTAIIIFLSVASAMGIAGWFGFVINIISAGSPMTVMVVAIADAIHVLTPFMLAMSKGADKETALRQSLNINLVPMTLTSLTTAVGFLGLNFAGATAFRDFGNIVAFGVVVAYVLTLMLLPALMLLLPMKVRATPLLLKKFISSTADFSIKHAKFNLWWPLVLAIICISQFPKLEFDDDLGRNIGEDVPFRVALEHANEHLVGYQSIVYSLDSNVEGGVNDPAFLRKVDEFSQWLRLQKKVSNVTSYVDTAKKLNQAMHGDDVAWYQVPANKELASQYMLLYEMSLPVAIDLTSDINIDRSALRLQISLKQMSNKELIELEKSAHNWLQLHAPELTTIGTGNSLLLALLGNQMLVDMTSGSLTVLVLIIVIVMIGLGSFRYGMISILPNIFPAIIVFGVWAMTIRQVNAAAALSFSVSLGLIVDDTIHFLSKYIKAKKKSLNTEEAIRYAFDKCGSSLFVTTVALGVGISLLTFSQFLPNATSAKLLSPIIFVALVMDLLFLPALLLAVDQKKGTVQI